MSKLTELKERNTGEVLFPKTVTTNVYTENGNKLSVELDNKANIEDLPNVVGEEVIDNPLLEEINILTREEIKKDLFIDMWNTVCGVLGQYNKETGFFELNGLTDLTYEDAIKIMSYSKHWSYYHFSINSSTNKLKIRTNLTPQGYSNTKVNSFNMLFYNQTDIEVINLDSLSLELGYNYGILANEAYAEKVFMNCTNLHTIYGNIDVSNMSLLNDWFNNDSKLVDVRLKMLKKNVSFKDCSLLSLDSLSYIIQNRGSDNSITITVHPDIYAKLVGDTTNAAYNSLTEEEKAQWTALVPLAQSKNISFATV